LNRLLYYRKLLILVSQICLLAISYYGSFLLRFDFPSGCDLSIGVHANATLVVAVELFVFYALVFSVDGGVTLE